MLAGRIDGATRNLGAPRDWDEQRQGRCGSLAVRHEETTAGPAMTSAWFPTEEEIARLRAGAPVYLTVIGESHPPVAMAVGPAPTLAG
jgi:hypothetical protein